MGFVWRLEIIKPTRNRHFTLIVISWINGK